MIRAVVPAVLAVLALAAPAAAEYRAAPGRVTLRLPPESPYTPSAEAVAALPDGATLLAGTSGRRAFAARLRPDGGPDRGYGAKGIAELPGIFVSGLAALPDGSAVVVMDARAGGGPPARLVRLDPSGHLDQGYGQGGHVDLTQIHGEGPVTATAGGGVVVAGPLDQGNGYAAMRVTPQGAVDPAFGTGGLAPVDQSAAFLATAADGGVLVASELSGAGRLGRRTLLAKLTPAGQPDAGFGGGTGEMRVPLSPDAQPVVDGQGRTWMAGSSATTGKPAVVRVLGDGTLDPSFAGVPRSVVQRLLLTPDGAVAAGTDSKARVVLTRLTDTGATAGSSRTSVRLGGGTVDVDDALGPLGGGFYLISSGALRPDGSVLLAGAAGLVGSPDSEGDVTDIATQPAVVALRAGGGLERTFGRPTHAPRLRLTSASRPAAGRTVRLRLRTTARGLARITVSAGGRVIGRRMEPLRRPGRHTVRVRLTRRFGGGPATVRVAADDMAGNVRRSRFHVRL
jgi:uncharacterized delta-60 repeat protein